MKRVIIVWIILGTLSFAYVTYKWFKYQEIVTSGNYAHTNAIGVLSNYLWQHGKLPCNQADFEIFTKQSDTIGNWEIAYEEGKLYHEIIIKLYFRINSGNTTYLVDYLKFGDLIMDRVDRVFLTTILPAEVFSYTYDRFGSNARTTSNAIAKETLNWHYEQVFGFPVSNISYLPTPGQYVPVGFFIENNSTLSVRVHPIGCAASRLSQSYLDSLAAQVTLLAQGHSYKGNMFFRLIFAPIEEIASFDCL